MIDLGVLSLIVQIEYFNFCFGLFFLTAQNMSKLLQLSLDPAEEVCDMTKLVHSWLVVDNCFFFLS